MFGVKSKVCIKIVIFLLVLFGFGGDGFNFDVVWGNVFIGGFF